MARRILVVIAVIEALLAACLGGAAGARIIPQLGWLGSCTDQGWSRDGRTAVGFFSHPVPSLVTWDARTWEVLSYRPLTDIADPSVVSYGSLNRDCTLLAVSIKGEGTRIVDVASGRTTMNFPGALAGFGQMPGSLIELKGKEVRLWNLSRREVIRTVRSSRMELANAEVSPNGRFLFTLDAGGHGVLWNVQTGKRLHALRYNAPLMAPIVFSPDSKYLATDGDDPQWRPPNFAATEAAYARTYRLLLWDTRAGRLVLRREDHYSLDGGTMAFVFAEGGRKLLSCGWSRIDVWTIPGGKRVRTFTGSDKLLQSAAGNSHRGPHSPFSLSPDGKVLAAGPERWFYPSFKLSAFIPMDIPGANWLAFSPDGTRLAAILSTDAVVVWDLRKPHVLSWIPPHGWSTDTRVQFLANDRVATYTYGSNINLYSALTGEALGSAQLPDKQVWVPWARLSPDGTRLAASVIPGRNEGPVLGLWDTRTLSKITQVTPGPLMDTESAFSPDGRWLAVGGHGSGTLYDLKKSTHRNLPDLYGQFAFSPDARLMASYKRESRERPRPSGVVISTLDGKTLWTLGEAYLSCFRPVAFSPDGKRVAAVSGSHLGLFDADTGKPALALEDVGAVRQVAFSPDGRRIAGTSGQGVTLWDAATGKVSLTLTAIPPDPKTGKDGFWFAGTPDGRYNASPGAESRLRCVEGGSARPASACGAPSPLP